MKGAHSTCQERWGPGHRLVETVWGPDLGAILTPSRLLRHCSAIRPPSSASLVRTSLLLLEPPESLRPPPSIPPSILPCEPSSQPECKRGREQPKPVAGRYKDALITVWQNARTPDTGQPAPQCTGEMRSQRPVDQPGGLRVWWLPYHINNALHLLHASKVRHSITRPADSRHEGTAPRTRLAPARCRSRA